MSLSQREHLIRVLADFDTAMLFTHTANGNVHGRPMALADVQSDGSIYFSTAATSPKIRELEADPRVTVGVQSKTRFASLSGTATVSNDRALIRQLWKESWKLWFPRGVEDPEIRLIRFEPSEGEYWDDSGARGIQFVIQAAKAYLNGEQPDDEREQNAKVSL